MLINVFISLFSIIGLLIASKYLQKQKVDDYRTDLFSLRHELFMLGATGEIDLNSEVYRYLERKINGSIRYAHKINYPFLILTLKIFKYKKIDFGKARAEQDRIFSQIHNKELKKKLNRINNQMSSSLFSFLVKTSWIFKIELIVLFFKNAKLNPDIKTQIKNPKIQNLADTLAFEDLEIGNYGLAV